MSRLGEVKRFLDVVIRAGEKSSNSALPVFSLKIKWRKYASLEPLIGHLTREGRDASIDALLTCTGE